MLLAGLCLHGLPDPLPAFAAPAVECTSMPATLSDLTLEQFRAQAAGRQPVPAGVAVAAVCAGFALGLLVKVLAVSGSRKSCPVEPGTLETLTGAAQAASTHMLQLGQDDVAAFEAYLAAARLPRTTDRERSQRRQALESAVAHAIELPLAAAREAAEGLRLSGAAFCLTPPALLADLGSVTSLLSGALRTFLMCADSNVRLLAPETSAYQDGLASAAKRAREALREADELLERIAASLQAGARPATDR